jgi:hypothetical protein
MIACPNKNSPAWREMVDRLGEYEAYKAFLSKGDLLTIEEIESLFNDGDTVNYLHSSGEVIQTTYDKPAQIDFNNLNKSAGSSITKNILSSLSNRLGVEYSVISAADATEITNDSANPWSGEKAFFYGGKVYLLDGKFSAEDAVHEFIHPLVTALRLSNPTLFYNLASEAMGNDTIASIIEASYSDYKEEQKLEEALVRAIQNSVKIEEFQLPKNFIQRVIYGIKQVLKQIFGKGINVSNLSLDTTIVDLAKMLSSEEFSLDMEAISKEDYVSYVRDIENLRNELVGVEKSSLAEVIGDMYTLVSSQLSRLKRNSKMKIIKDILADEANRGYLQGVKADLKNVNSLESILNDSVKEVEDMKRRSQQFIYSLYRIKAMVSRINQELGSLQGKEDQETFDKVYYFDSIISSWNKVLNKASTYLVESGLPTNGLLAKEIDTISKNVERTQNMINDIYKDSTTDLLWESLKSMSENISAEYDKKIADAKKAGAMSRVKEFEAEKKKFVFDKKKIRGMLSGLGDANAMSSFFESYINNPDLIVGGFSLYLKNNLIDIQVKAQERVNDIKKSLVPLLEAAGYDPNNVAKFGKQITFRDKKVKITDEGETEEYEVIKFLDRFKGYEADRARLRHELQALDAGTDYVKIREKIRELQQWEANYMHREYVSEFYEKDKIYTDAGEVGYEAKYDRDLVLERINNHRHKSESSGESTEEDRMVEKELWKEYRELSSLTYPDGTKKFGRDLEKAQLHKAYRQENRKYYEEIEIKGAFEDALKVHEQSLVNNGLQPGSAEFEEARSQWIEDNTRSKIDDSYYTEKKRILDQISSILSKFPGAVELSKQVSEAYNEILNLSSTYRDEDGQIIGTEVTDGRREAIKLSQEKTLDLKSKMARISGMTVSQFERLQELKQIKTERDFTEEENVEFADLLRVRDVTGMSATDRSRLSSLYGELSTLHSKTSTDYYTDIVNAYIAKIVKANPDVKVPFEKGVNARTADRLLSAGALPKLFELSPEFQEWFEANHVKTTTLDYSTGTIAEKYERLFIWNRNVPANKFAQKTKLSTGEEISGVPGNEYFFRSVKKEFRTEKKVGKTIDNRGNWLPKTLAEGAVDDKYINQDYFKLQKENPKMFTLLEEMKRFHLEHQVGASKSAKLYLEIPRYQKENLEYLKTTDVVGEKVGAIRSAYKAVKANFVASEDDAEEGYNFDATQSFDLTKADMFDDEISTIQVSGKYSLPIDQVSMDVVGGMVRYMMSVERQKKLIEINPQVQALQKVLRDPRNAVKDMSRINKAAFITKGIVNPLNKKGAYVRAQAIESLIAREFDGEKVTGIGADNVTVQKTMNTLFGLASFRFFAFDIPSGLKNRFGAIVQNNIEAIGGKYFSMSEYFRAKVDAAKATGEISAQIYSRQPKSLQVQMVEVFDPVQGRFQQKMADFGSRTLLRDLATTSPLFSPRKLLELEASMEFFFSMMRGQKVKQTINGQTKEIAYVDAWELKEGQLVLKEGIDKSFDKGGEEFKKFVNRTHDLMNKLQGTYAEFDQPQAQRYLVYKAVSFLRRFFTSMFMNRFGDRRYNSSQLELSSGYYRDFLRFMKALFKNAAEGTMYFTPEEKIGALKTVTEFAQLIFLAFSVSFAFGFDADDEDKYRKMRERSGPLPFPGVADSEYDFDFGGWLFNHAMYQTMMVQAENRQFIPLPTISIGGTSVGFGFSDYVNMLDVSSVVIGPTFQAYAKIVEDMIQLLGDDERAFYKSDMGPYTFQQKESAKVLNHTAKLFGVKGTSIDPTEGVKTFVSIEARNR